MVQHGLNKVQCNYISSLRAVEFLITIVINKALESGISKLAKFGSIFRTEKTILGLVNFNSRFLDLPSGVTAI